MTTEAYQRILEYFNLDPEEKAKRLQQVFNDSMEFFKQFRESLSTGSPEEQEEMLTVVHELRKKIQEEVTRICEDTGLTQDELEAAASNPNMYTEEQWKIVEKSQKEVEKQTRLLQSTAGVEDKPKKQSKKKKKKWVKS